MREIILLLSVAVCVLFVICVFVFTLMRMPKKRPVDPAAAPRMVDAALQMVEDQEGFGPDGLFKCTIRTPQHKNGKVFAWLTQTGTLDTGTYFFYTTTKGGHGVQFVCVEDFLKHRVDYIPRMSSVKIDYETKYFDNPNK